MNNHDKKPKSQSEKLKPDKKWKVKPTQSNPELSVDISRSEFLEVLEKIVKPASEDAKD